jgi:hypothetical protein
MRAMRAGKGSGAQPIDAYVAFDLTVTLWRAIAPSELRFL